MSFLFLTGPSGRPSVGRSTGRIGLIVLVNSKVVPSELGMRSVSVGLFLFYFLFIFFLFFLFCYFLFCFFLFRPSQSSFSAARVYHGYVPGIISL